MLPRSESPYTAWASWLSAFAQGSEEPPVGLPPMDPEVLGGSVVARLTQRSAAALQARLELWLAAMRRDLDRSSTPVQLSAALAAARRRIGPIRAFASSDLLLPALRESLQKARDDSLTASHSGLMEQLGRDRLRNEALLRVAREQPLERSLSIDLGPADQPSAPAASRRPILLG
jgi:hypothetical protein